MKKVILAAALVVGLATVSFAGNPVTKSVNDERPVSSRNEDPVSKWFHFNGDGGLSTDLNDPSKYSTEVSPECSTAPNTYRCDIYIQVSEDDEDVPDLSQSIQQERKESTAQ